MLCLCVRLVSLCEEELVVVLLKRREATESFSWWFGLKELVQELQTARIKDRREKGGERERSIASAVACRGTTLASLLKKLLAEPSASGAPVAYYALRPAAATAARTTPRARRSAATTTTSPATTAAASTRMPTPVAAVAPASSLKTCSTRQAWTSCCL